MNKMKEQVAWESAQNLRNLLNMYDEEGYSPLMPFRVTANEDVEQRRFVFIERSVAKVLVEALDSFLKQG